MSATVSSSSSADTSYKTANNTSDFLRDVSPNDTTYYSTIENHTNTQTNDSGINFSSIEVSKQEHELTSNNNLSISKHTEDSPLFVEGEISHTSELLKRRSSSSLSGCQSKSPDSLIILSSSHNCSTSVSSIHDENASPQSNNRSVSESSCSKSIDNSFIRKLINDAYTKDENESYEQEDMEYDESWQPHAQSSPAKKTARQKIFIKDLSFDELKDLCGIDLMAPVFLAVTDEADDNVNDLRRKAKSIEDLCSTTYNDDSSFRPRSRSELPAQYKQKKKVISSSSSHDTNFYDLMDDLNSGVENVKDRSLRSSSSLDDDIYLPSVSDQYNESLDDSLEEQAMIDVFVNNGMYDEECFNALNDINHDSFDALREMNESLIFGEQNSIKSGSDTTYDDNKKQGNSLEKTPRPNVLSLMSKNDSESAKTPENNSATASGFWEYPYGDSPTAKTPNSAHFNRQLSLNTSPKSSMISTSMNDRFVVVNVTGQQRVVDMKLIEPYLKVLSHGGHHKVGDERHVLLVFSACYLPQKHVAKYHIIMEQLFYYFVHAVDLLVTDTYEIIYFNSAMDGKNMPSHAWIKQCYDMLQHRLKKNMQAIYFVHQSIWLKTILRFSKLFVSSKFRRKIRFIKNIKMLQNHVPLEYIYIPAEIYDYHSWCLLTLKLISSEFDGILRYGGHICNCDDVY